MAQESGGIHRHLQSSDYLTYKVSPSIIESKIDLILEAGSSGTASSVNPTLRSCQHRALGNPFSEREDLDS
jgi:hypothetical protein